ncbi:MAG: hypothetical protein AAFQ53_17275 [Bacteroidota bacterium]
MKLLLLSLALLTLSLAACDSSSVSPSTEAPSETASAQGWFGPDEFEAVVQQLPAFLAEACATPGPELAEFCEQIDA